MSFAIPGVAVAKQTGISQTTLTDFADLDEAPARTRKPANQRRPISPGPMDEVRWPAWKVTVFVVAFCGAFWGGVIWLAMRLLG